MLLEFFLICFAESEGVGFEPTVGLTLRSISSRVPSTGLSHPSMKESESLRFEASDGWPSIQAIGAFCKNYPWADKEFEVGARRPATHALDLDISELVCHGEFPAHSGRLSCNESHGFATSSLFGNHFIFSGCSLAW